MKKQRLHRVLRKVAEKPFFNGFKQLRHNHYVQQSVSQTLKVLFGNRVFAVMVVIPVILFFIYNALIFTPRYASIASIAIKDNQGNINAGGLGALLGSVSSGTTNPYMLQSYIQSLNMLQNLDNSIHLINLYQSHKIDFLSRLSSTANQKSQLDYYLSKIDVKYMQDSQSIELAAQGITPKEAQYILNSIINSSQDYVNNIDFQLAKQRLDFSQKQLQIAQAKLSDANQGIISFQNNNGILDPKSDVSTLAGIMAGLQSQLVGFQTELVNMQEYMQKNAPDIQRQQEKIASIQQQINLQRQKILGMDGDKNNSKLNEVVNMFEWLRMQAQVAISEYTAAIASLEVAKSDTISQKQQVVVLQSPTLPNYNEYPRLWYSTLTLFIILVMIYGIIRMTKTIIDEHRY